ncbi:MAG TPA: regulatory protein RecX [Clostridia bacterium]|nr:regulatory protein RecX [Clostridia bacterium]
MTFKRSNRTYDEASLYEYAVGALGRRMRTVVELKRLMRTRVGKQADGDTLVGAVITRLKDHHYLDDSHFAAVYSSFRKDNEKFGRMRVKQDLKLKGVQEEVIEQAVTAVYDGISDEQQARRFLSRKRLKKPTDQKETARIFRTMVRAGFGTRTIVGILKNWDVEDETLMLLEQEQAEAETRIEDEEA